MADMSMKRKRILISIAAILALIALVFVAFFIIYSPDKFEAIDLSSYKNENEIGAMSQIDLSVTTFNIRCAVNEKDTSNNWASRKYRVLEHIENLDSDIIGIQEARTSQLNYITDRLDDYAAVGEVRDYGMMFSEKSAILYKTSVFELLETRTFWLSSTPEKVSKYKASSMKRICTFAVLKHIESGKIIIAANTHLDHVSEKARLKQVKALCKMFESVNVPMFITGDFNFNENESGYSYMTNFYSDSMYLADTTTTADVTYHGFYDSAEMDLDLYIDYCFVSSGINVRSYEVDKEDIDGKPYSDHYSITVKVTI